MRTYKDIHGNIINAGDIIRCLLDGKEHLVEMNAMETDLGIDGTNKKCVFAKKVIYPLYQFDLKNDWEIVKKKEMKSE